MGSPLPANSQLVGPDSVALRPPEPGSCPWPVYRCNVDQKYRSLDGSCNNLADPVRGRSFTPLARYLPPDYADGTYRPTDMYAMSQKAQKPLHWWRGIVIERRSSAGELSLSCA